MTYRTVPRGAAPATPIVDDATIEHFLRTRRMRADALQAARTRREALDRRRKLDAIAKRARGRRPMVALHEDAGGTLLRFRHRGFRPYLMSFYAATVLALLGLIIVFAVAEPGFGLLLGILSLGPLAALPGIPLFKLIRELRPVHLYVTRSGRFVVYERTPHEPIAVGLTSELELDHRHTSELEHRVAIKSGSHGHIECKNLLQRDILLMERLGRANKFEVR